jgi:hypothetical protein
MVMLWRPAGMFDKNNETTPHFVIVVASVCYKYQKAFRQFGMA